jgi:hypothetical protein
MPVWKGKNHGRLRGPGQSSVPPNETGPGRPRGTGNGERAVRDRFNDSLRLPGILAPVAPAKRSRQSVAEIARADQRELAFRTRWRPS